MADDYVLMSGDIASNDMSGDVMVGVTNIESGGGSTVEVNPIVTEGTKIAEISVDGDVSELYTPTTSLVTPSTTIYTNYASVATVKTGDSTSNIKVPTTTYINSIGTTGVTEIGTIRCGSTNNKVYVPSTTNTVTYSTTEQAIGTWVDGRTVYKKTFIVQDRTGVASSHIYYLIPSGQNDLTWSDADSTSVKCLPGYNNSTWRILRVEGSFDLGTGYVMNFPVFHTVSTLNNIYVSPNGNLELFTVGISTYKNAYVTVTYVKAS